MKKQNKISPENFFQSASKIAEWYGFTSFDKNFKGSSSPIKNKDIKIENRLKERGTGKTMLMPFIRFYLRNRFAETETPMLAYCSNIDKETNSMSPSSSKSDNAKFNLVVLGLEDAFAEALLMSCANKIIKDMNKDEFVVKINSMGDKQSAENYENSFKETFRKKIDMMPMHCANVFNKNYCDAHKMIHTNEDLAEIRSYMPTTLKYLSDSSQGHLQSVLEYLDAHQITYSLSQHLMDTHEHCTHTLFEISGENKDIKAYGGRYDALSEFLFNKPIPVAYATIEISSKTQGRYSPKKKVQRKPKVFFIYSGYYARLKSLPILTQLKESNINIKHRLHYSRVHDQVQGVDNCPLMLILGQKEAVEGTARVKNMKNKSHELIPLKNLALYLKRMQNLQR